GGIFPEDACRTPAGAGVSVSASRLAAALCRLRFAAGRERSATPTRNTRSGWFRPVGKERPFALEFIPTVRAIDYSSDATFELSPAAWGDGSAVVRCSKCRSVCKERAITTVDMACLKINCSWLLVSITTEYLSNERILPVSFTPLIR